MSINALYDLADKITTLKSTLESNANFQSLSFYTKLCGVPKLMGNINLPILYVQTVPVQAGNIFGYSCEVIVHGRKLEGVLDLDNQQVYESSTGVLFIYRYNPPTRLMPMEFAYFDAPRLALTNLRSMHEAFTQCAETLVESIPLPKNDELIKLKLVNQLAHLQYSAYLQGKGLDVNNEENWVENQEVPLHPELDSQSEQSPES